MPETKRPERCVFTPRGKYYHQYGKACGGIGTNAYVTTVVRAEGRGLRRHNCYSDPDYIEV